MIERAGQTNGRRSLAMLSGIVVAGVGALALFSLQDSLFTTFKVPATVVRAPEPANKPVIAVPRAPSQAPSSQSAPAARPPVVAAEPPRSPTPPAPVAPVPSRPAAPSVRSETPSAAAPPVPAPVIPPAASVPAPMTQPAPAPPQPRPASILLPRPDGARPVIAPFADADVAQVVTRQIRRFNESRDVTEKQDATRQIYAAALIGHPLARSVIVSAYRSSTIVQNAAQPADVVRMGLDFAARGRPDGATGFAAVAGFLAERDAPAFGRALFDAMRDDSRLRDPAAAQSVVRALAQLPAACDALAATAGVSTAAGCDGALAEAVARQAAARGVSGQEDAAYKNAERLFARYLQDAL